MPQNEMTGSSKLLWNAAQFSSKATSEAVIETQVICDLKLSHQAATGPVAQMSVKQVW